jgi:hypothetical protein
MEGDCVVEGHTRCVCAGFCAWLVFPLTRFYAGVCFFCCLLKRVSRALSLPPSLPRGSASPSSTKSAFRFLPLAASLPLFSLPAPSRCPFLPLPPLSSSLCLSVRLRLSLVCVPPNYFTRYRRGRREAEDRFSREAAQEREAAREESDRSNGAFQDAVRQHPPPPAQHVCMHRTHSHLHDTRQNNKTNTDAHVRRTRTQTAHQAS